MNRAGATFVLLGTFLAAGARGIADEKAASHGLGLLAGRATDDAAREKLKAGLADARPEVRAAATRVINVSAVGPLVPSLVAALATETDRAAASEMIRFLGALDRPEFDQAVFDASRRLGAPVHEPLADAIGRRPGAASHIHALRDLGLGEDSWQTFYALATAGAATAPAAMGSTILRERDAAAWRALLNALHKSRTPLDTALAAEAVRSESTDIRKATYWRLALDANPARPPDAALAAALGESPEVRTSGPVDPAAALAFEVLRRVQGGAPRPLAGTFKALGPGLKNAVAPALATAGGLVQVFDKTERRAISMAFFGKEDSLDKWRPVPVGSSSAAVSAYSRVQTASGFPPEYVGDVLRATGCDFEGFGAILGGEVTYAADGRPRKVGLIPRGGSKECLEATRVLLISTLAPLGVPTRAERDSLVLVPDRPEFMQCMDEAARLPPFRGRRVHPDGDDPAKGRVKEPRKVRDRRPIYPASAKQRGVQGVVILEAEMAPSGCIHQVTLVLGRDTSLDLEAIRAVSGWGYAPALLDGQPVPVTMTVTVNFNLSR